MDKFKPNRKNIARTQCNPISKDFATILLFKSCDYGIFI